jgi:TolB-like protein/DNA-binding winged helix-turn-helix (wHTH) protein/tetratricopeptide (TPR) repeat protein
MPEVARFREVIRFGLFEVDVRARELRKQSVKIKLQEQPFQVLLTLLENPGEIITREELQRRIWPSDTFVDFDHGISNAMKRLREALGDSAGNPQFVETLSRKGYRWIAAVNRNGPPTATLHEEGLTANEDEADNLSYLKPALITLAAIASLVVLPGLGTGVRSSLGSTTVSPAIHSLAVLPLQNLSGDRSQEYFSDGMTDELITQLAQIKGLSVISRTTMVHYKNTDKRLTEIARELNVDAIVTGSVLRSGNRVRIAVQLIQASTDANIWAESYDRSVEDTLAMQEAVAVAIAGRMKSKMMETGGVHRQDAKPVNFKAHEAYLRGLEQYRLQGKLSNHLGKELSAEQHHARALEYYSEAVREDPTYGFAYLGLANVASTAEDAEAYARKALEVDDSLADAHLILGAIRLVRDRNWQQAEHEIQRALELAPNSAAAHHEYGFLLDTENRFEQGMAEYQRAQALDPASSHLSGSFYSRRQFDQVIRSARAELAGSPEQFTSDEAILHKLLAVAYARTGKQKESIQEFRRGMLCMGYKDLDEDLGRGFSRGGYQAALRDFLKGLKKHPDFPFMWLKTYAYTELGDSDHALAGLSHIYDQDDWGNVGYSDAEAGYYNTGVLKPTLVTLRIEPMWDPLHSDPRFDQLVRSVGFPH